MDRVLEAMESLAAAVQRLGDATGAQDLHAVVARAAKELAGVDLVTVGSPEGPGPLPVLPEDRSELSDVERCALQVLADVAALAFDNVRMREQLAAVADRTAAVSEANAQLEQEIEEHWRFAAEVYRQSVTDELTGLYNRRGFFKRAEQELALLRESERPGLCLFIDVDGLKDINDREGHDAGDQLLADAAEMLRRIFRTDDVIARIGGDEFAVFVSGYADVDRVLDRLREHEEHVRLSIGTAVFDPVDPRGLYELLGAADANMYDDKRARRGG